MKLHDLHLQRYKRARDVSLTLGDLIVLIGPNSSGKSTIVDAFRFLATALVVGDFSGVVAERGGFVNLAWKGEDARFIQLTLSFAGSEGVRFVWDVRLEKRNRDFVVRETVKRVLPSQPPVTILENDPSGDRWWWSDSSASQERLSIEPTACALSVAGKNEGFPGREVHEHVRTWVFADPNPSLLKQPASPDRPVSLEFSGRNLPARLQVIRDLNPQVFERIRQTVSDVSGVALDRLEVRELEDGRLVLSVREQGFEYNVNQPALSNGILRILAFAVTLLGSERPGLFAAEEPENYVHPTAMEGLVQLILEVSKGTQVILTTHSPLLLDYLADRPESVLVVGSTRSTGTTIATGGSPEDLEMALKESGFSLGTFWLSRGFKGGD